MLMTSSAYADMNRVCSIVLPEELLASYSNIREQLERYNCERNNVLQVIAPKFDEYTDTSLLLVSSQFCRFDRNRDIERGVLSCILYSTKARAEP